MQLEKPIVRSILSFLDEIGLMVWQNDSVGVFDPTKKVFRKSNNKFKRNGVPDILGYLPNGRGLAIEVKAPAGRPTPAQLKFITEATSTLAVAFISRSVWQTYSQLLSFWPEIKSFEQIANKYRQIEEKPKREILARRCDA
jgi:hypothetical protein